MSRFQDHRGHVEAVMGAVRSRTDPFQATLRALQGRAGGAPIILSIAVGKAAPAMDAALVEWGGAPDAGRLIVTTEGTPLRDRAGIIFFADHPVPTDRNVEASTAVEEAVRAARSKGTGAIVLLLSGGASALLARPAEGVSLADLREVTRLLLEGGAPIEALNCVRKHVETLKGGRLAALAAPAPVEAFILSDVVGDRLDVIGSGPVTADPTTFGDALAVLDRCAPRAPKGVRAFLEAGAAGASPETPKPGDPALAGVATTIVGSNVDAISAAFDTARLLRLGRRIHSPLVGEAAAAGERVARAVIHAQGRPIMLIWGGETTVSIGGATGRGGRNQEVALAAAIAIDRRPNLAIAAWATDGVDGPTPAAGAMVTGETCGLAHEAGLDAAAALRNHDSYTFFAALDAAYPDRPPHLIRTGPTGTNVNDVAVGLAYEERLPGGAVRPPAPGFRFPFPVRGPGGPVR